MTGLAPHLAAIRDSRHGQLVRCTVPKDDDLLDWVARQWPGLGRNAAHRLLTRAGGDLAAARDAGARSRATGLTEEKYIDVLCAPRPGEEFAELLVAGDRQGALAAARDMPAAGPSGAGAVIGLLDSRLGTLAAIREGQRRQLEARDIAGQLGVPRFLLAGTGMPLPPTARPGCSAAGSCWPWPMRRGGPVRSRVSPRCWPPTGEFSYQEHEESIGRSSDAAR